MTAEPGSSSSPSAEVVAIEPAAAGEASGAVEAREVGFAASDGWPLQATLFRPAGERAVGRSVIVGPGMGIQRTFYRRFARRLAAHGLPTLVLDWRGIGGSARGPIRRSNAALADWGERDLPAAITWMDAEMAPASMAYVGHSIAGAVLGLSASAGRFARILLVAAQNGYWKLWDGPSKLAMLGIWSAIPAATAVIGYLPRWALGGACPLPPRVASEWARWGRRADHVASHAPGVRERFAGLRAPVRAYLIDDDWIAPRRAAEAFAANFASAPVEQKRLTAAELGVPRIGHFGFFRPELAGLWEDAASWLRSGA
jgi:predicted alpha/beta hydrolase